MMVTMVVVMMMMMIKMVMINLMIKIICFESLISVVDCKGAGCCCCGQTLWCVPVPASLCIIVLDVTIEKTMVESPFGLCQYQ